MAIWIGFTKERDLDLFEILTMTSAELVRYILFGNNKLKMHRINVSLINYMPGRLEMQLKREKQTNF